MNNKKLNSILLHFFVLLIINSCSINEITGIKTESTSEQAGYCESISHSSLDQLGENQEIQDVIKSFSQIENNLYLQFLINSYLQRTSNTQATSENSKIISIIKVKGKVNYISFLKNDDQNFNSYIFHGAQIIDSKINLNNELRKINKAMPINVPISQKFEKFIISNKIKFSKNEKTRQVFFRGNQPLNAGETLKRSAIENIDIKKINNPLNFLFQAKTGLDCNFDYNLYNHQNLSIKKNQSTNINIFGSFVDHNNFFVTITNSSSDNSEPIDQNGFIDFASQKTSAIPAALCFNEKYLFISTDQVNAENILVSSIENNIFKELNFNANNFYLNQRKLELDGPRRLIVENFGKPVTASEFNINYVPTIGSIDTIIHDFGLIYYQDPRITKVCN